MRYVRFNINEIRSDPRVGWWYEQVSRRPSWVWKVAGIVAIIVIVLPILALAFAAALAFLIIFALLSVITGITSLIDGMFGRTDTDIAKRRNVRVIHPDDEP